MKKIALLAMILLGSTSMMMAQETETETKDSVFLVKNGEVVAAQEISEGDYVTFARPTDAWHVVKSGVKFYTYYNALGYNNYSNLWQNGSTNEFAIDDFLGSGTSLYFTVEDEDWDGKSWETLAGNITPTSPVVTDTSSGYTMYHFYPNSESWSWTDATNEVTYTSVWIYGDGYSVINAADSYLCLSIDRSVNDGDSAFSYLYGVW